MSPFEMVWNTFEFHTNQINTLEREHLSNIAQYQDFVASVINPTRKERLLLKKQIDGCCSKLITEYKKQIDCIDEMVDGVQNNSFETEEDIEILNSFEIDWDHILQLKNLTATLMKEMIQVKSKINEVLS
tara:strand:+ start:4391 stop:4780 length:390 start_codon:yes stop_codon:yes gene_type:complete